MALIGVIALVVVLREGPDNMGAAKGGGGAGGKKLSIAVIPKGTTHLFWKSVEAGAGKAGKDWASK